MAGGYLIPPVVVVALGILQCVLSETCDMWHTRWEPCARPHALLCMRTQLGMGRKSLSLGLLGHSLSLSLGVW